MNIEVPDVVKNYQCTGCLRDASEGCYIKKDDLDILCRLYLPAITVTIVEEIKRLGNDQVDRMRMISKAKSDASLARLLGVSQCAIRPWRSRKYGITEKMLENAAEKLSIDIGWIRSGNKTNINSEDYP